VAEREGIELDIRASRDQVERLKATWGEWSTLLKAHNAPLADGTYGAALARSILRKVLVSPVVVTPMVGSIEFPASCDWSKVKVIVGPAFWRFRGVSRFDSIISGGLSRGEVTVDANALWHTSDALACMGLDADYRGPHPISGGSDAPLDVVPVGRGLSRPLTYSCREAA